MAGFFDILLGKPKAEGSAFTKIADNDSKELEAKGRIVAIDAANKAKSDSVDFLDKEVTRVHSDADTIKSRFDSVLSKL